MTEPDEDDCWACGGTGSERVLDEDGYDTGDDQDCGRCWGSGEATS